MTKSTRGGSGAHAGPAHQHRAGRSSARVRERAVTVEVLRPYRWRARAAHVLQGYRPLPRGLDKASDRLTMWPIGKSDEGREMVAVAIADDGDDQVARQIQADNRAAHGSSKDYRAAGQAAHSDRKADLLRLGIIHSPETGRPEMLMELAYRLFRSIRARSFRRFATTHHHITPATEVDGRDKQVDSLPLPARPTRHRPNLVYWGKYAAHDNNRDGMVMSLVLTRTMMRHVLQLAPHRAARPARIRD